MDVSGGSGGGSEDGSSVGGGGSVASVVTAIRYCFLVYGEASEPSTLRALAVMLYFPASRSGTCNNHHNNV